MSEQSGGTPLARLFAIGYRTLIEDLHRELRARGWQDLRPAYGFVLLAARDRTAVSELAVLLGMTKQACSKLVSTMVDAGYLDQGAEGHDGRRKQICLTGRGRSLLAEVESIYREREQQWAQVIGADRVELLRSDLESLLLDPATRRLPALRPLW